MLSDIIPTFRLDGHLTILTGGSGGVAHSLAQALIAQGSELALVDLRLEALESTRVELQTFAKANGIEVPKISIWEMDVANASQVDSVVEKINNEHGKVADRLLHTAGYCQNIPAFEYDAAKAQALVNVNLMGSLYICQSMARALKAANKPGSLALIASMSGLIVNHPQPQVAYNMSKAGVIHLVRSLAAEWAPFNIRVNAISPGYIATPLTVEVIAKSPEGQALKKQWEDRIPMGRMATPKEFVGAMLYLLSDSASSYTTGENMVIDGGYTCW